ncbi:MAG: AMP-binding protein [Bacteroidales bacterium]|nr:AMP-binding protein [Bacteroidales bacterium]
MEHKFTNLQQMLQHNLKNYATKDSYGFAGKKAITYQEYHNKVASYAALLASYGIQKEDKVALLSPNSPQWCMGYYSAIYLGAIVVPLLNEFSEHEIDNILEHSETKAIFVSQRFFEKHKDVLQKYPLVVDVDTLEVYKADNAPVEKQLKMYFSKPDDIAVIIYTSGTTGKSKGVMLTHKNLISQLKQLFILQPVHSYDVYLSVLPLSHVLEASLCFLYSIMRGASIYFLRKPPTASVLLPALKQVRPSIMLTVPLIIEKIFNSKIYPELTKTPLLRTLYSIPFMRKVMHKKACAQLMETFGGRIRFFGIGGAKLDKTVERFLLEGGFPYAIGYGLTETAPLLAGANPSMVRLQSTGPAVEGVTLKINNPDPRTGEGEIWAKGDNVMKGYYKEPELTKEVLTEDGWFKTGDIGFIDKKNILFIKSRLKNVIISSNGENIYPEDIESVINSFKGVLESIVVEKKGKLVALVNFNIDEMEKQYEQLKENVSNRVDEIKDELDTRVEKLKSELVEYVNSRVSKSSKIAYVIHIKAEFDKTPTSKIKRYKYAFV